METIIEIEPYITVKHKGIDWLHYLTIHGGQGHGKNMGGKFRFVLAYLSPDEHSEMGATSLDIYCQSKSIIFGAADTIDEAYENYKLKLEGK